MDPGIPDHDTVAGAFTDALSQAMSCRSPIVPKGTEVPSDAIKLTVRITALDPIPFPKNPAVAGFAHGVALGTVGALAGGRGVASFFHWGLLEGANQAREKRWIETHRGYAAHWVRGRFRVSLDDSRKLVLDSKIPPGEILDRMRRLDPVDSEDPRMVRAEEARAFAVVVSDLIGDQLQWPIRRKAESGP